MAFLRSAQAATLPSPSEGDADRKDKSGMIDVHLFLEQNRTEEYSKSAKSFVHVLPLSPDVMKDGTQSLFPGANVEAGCVDVLQWWKESWLKVKYNVAAMNQASRSGRTEVLQWWLDSGYELRVVAPSNYANDLMDDGRLTLICKAFYHLGMHHDSVGKLRPEPEAGAPEDDDDDDSEGDESDDWIEERFASRPFHLDRGWVTALMLSDSFGARNNEPPDDDHDLYTILSDDGGCRVYNICSINSLAPSVFRANRDDNSAESTDALQTGLTDLQTQSTLAARDAINAQWREILLERVFVGMLDSLPAPVLVALADALPSSLDRCALSSVNSRLRATLAPCVFRAIRATNLDTDAAAIGAIVSAHSLEIRTLHLQCKLFPNSISPAEEETDGGGSAGNDEEEPVVVSHLSATAVALLSGRLAQNVTSAIIDFRPHRNFETPEYERHGWADEDAIVIMRSEDMDDASAAEAKYHWRRTMAELWRALAANTSIRNLEIRSLLPNITTAWHDDNWLTFIGRLERLSIQMWGTQTGSGINSIMTTGYTQFIGAHLTKYFFDLADDLLALELVAHINGCYGGEDLTCGAPTALGELNMPRLRSLNLHHTFIDRPLLAFIRAHASTIQSLRLTKCMAPAPFFGNKSESHLSWTEFFDGIVQSNPESLTDLEIENWKLPGFEVASYTFFYGDFNVLGSFQPSFERLMESQRMDFDAYFRLDDLVWRNLISKAKKKSLAAE
ncbi:hypothetical protein DFJ73DRAFT_787231 [Zopfochytrium polystomum]|nr:hypothetical protein DFJ73DRAFT_787231 [Zopfochytrium polystomum]